MLDQMILFRAAMAKRQPHPSLTRDEQGPRDFVQIPAKKTTEPRSEKE